jgi:hypothetical protein
VAALNMPEEAELTRLRDQRRFGPLLEGFGLMYGNLLNIPLALENDPFKGIPHRLPEGLRDTLHQRSVQDVVQSARRWEQAFLAHLEALNSPLIHDLAEELESAEAQMQTDARLQDQRAVDRLRSQLARGLRFMDRLKRRAEELERAEPFEPGAVGCSLEQGVDLSTEQSMMADLEALASTCPQQQLIAFLRAAAFIARAPAGSASPRAPMDAAAVMDVAASLGSAANAIAGLAAVLQRDFLVPSDTIPARLKKILDAALEGRSVAEVVRDGPAAERGFLPVLRDELARQLRAETDRGGILEPGTAVPKRPSARIRELRAKIERIDGRLDRLDASAGPKERAAPPGAN